MPSSPVIRCREITEVDIAGVTALLAKGFAAERKRDYWARALRTLAERQPPPDLPRYGYLLEHDGKPVGVLLTIFVRCPVDGAALVRCNVSSWYVEPGFRSYASLFTSKALKLKDVTYFNISPAPNTWPILEAQGYQPFLRGLFVSFPAFAPAVPGVDVRVVTSGIDPGDDMSAFEATLLQEHASYGCLSLICEMDGRRYPFVFRLSRKFGIIRRAHLLYCRDLTTFLRYAGPIGRHLGRRLTPIVTINANGPINGLVGCYRDGRPKYIKGPYPARVGDLSYTELAMFGS